MALQSVLPSIGRTFGYSDTLVAAAFSLSALFWTLSSPVWARLSDRHGRKRMIMVGMTGFVISMSGFGLSVSAGQAGLLGAATVFVLMVLSRAVYGLFGSAVPTAAQAYVADRTSRGERTQALAHLASAQGLGTVIGPAIAPLFVIPMLGLAGPIYAFALFGLVVWWATRRGLPSGDVPRTVNAPGEVPGKGLWKDRRILPFIVFAFLITSTQAINISVLGFHVIDELDRGPLEAQSFIGVAMLAGAAATLMAQWGLIRLFHMEPRELLRWGAGLALVGNAISAFAMDYYAVVLGYAVVSLGLGFARPGFMAGSSLALGPREQGAIAGLMVALMGLCFLFPPIIGVALYEWLGPTPFVLNAAMAAACVAMALMWRPLARAGQTVDPERTPAAPTP